MRVVRVTYRERAFYAALGVNEVMCLNKALGFNDPIPLAEVGVLPPVMPTKIVCVAVNYQAHAAEMGREVTVEPRIFLKPPTSVIGHGEAIIMPAASSRVDYEGELAVVIGQTCRNVRPDEVPAFVFGYSCANDVTARDLQQKDGLFGRAKGFDTFCPIGPWIETDVPDPGNLAVHTYLDDKIVQDSHTSRMICKPFDLVSFISGIMTLNPGDVILTGTPEGVGPMQPGQIVRVSIDGVGYLENVVVAEPGGPTPEATIQ